VRCKWKSKLRGYTSHRGGHEGMVFTAGFIDAEGTEITAVLFDEAATRHHVTLEVGRVYFIAQGSIKYSRRNRQSPTSSGYELTLDQYSDVRELEEDLSIPRQTYAFVSIQSLSRLPPSTLVDLIGVVVAVGGVENRSTSRGGHVSRLKLTLADESSHCVGLAVWGDKAQKLASELPVDARGQVLAIKGVRVYSWNEGDGVSLTAWEVSEWDINPDISSTANLLRWWNEEGGSKPTHLLQSIGPPVSHPSRESEEQQGTLADVRQNQGGVWRIQATLMMIKREAPLWYPACPLDRCGKKVEWNNMQWYCNRCQTLYEAPEYRYIARVMIADHTGSQWATCFNEAGATVFGVDAKQIVRWETEETPASLRALDECLQRALFQRFEFKLRLAGDSKAGVIGATPTDLTAGASVLVSAIKSSLQQQASRN